MWAESSDLPFQRSACAFSRDAPSLDPIALRRSLAAPGADARWRATFAKLDAGRPLTLGLFGASVAQNAGCTSQPDKRCSSMGRNRTCTARRAARTPEPYVATRGAHDSERRPRCDAAHRRTLLFTHVVWIADVVIGGPGSMAPFMKDVPRFSTTRASCGSSSPGRTQIILLDRDRCKGGGQKRRAGVCRGRGLRVCEHYGLTCISPRGARDVCGEDDGGRRRARALWGGEARPAPRRPALGALAEGGGAGGGGSGVGGGGRRARRAARGKPRWRAEVLTSAREASRSAQTGAFYAPWRRARWPPPLRGAPNAPAQLPAAGSAALTSAPRRVAAPSALRQLQLARWSRARRRQRPRESAEALLDDPQSGRARSSTPQVGRGRGDWERTGRSRAESGARLAGTSAAPRQAALGVIDQLAPRPV